MLPMGRNRNPTPIRPFPGARRRNGRTENPPHPYCVQCERPINKWFGTCVDCQLAAKDPDTDGADG